jgi:translation elongation factor EF-G
MIFVNKMDKIGADFYRCVEMIKERLGATSGGPCSCRSVLKPSSRASST